MCKPKVSVIIVNYNTGHLLGEMFDALLLSANSLSAQVIVIDNASVDGSAETLRAGYPQIELIQNARNIGFGRANNQGLRYIQGEYVLLLNTDAFVAPDTLSKTINYMDAHPLCGILGVKLAGRDGTLQPSCRYFPTPWNIFLQRTGLHGLFPMARLMDDMTWDHASVRKCDWVPGCYYLIRHEVINEIGLFDPRFFLYYEEVDHCFAAKRAGWEVHFFPDTTVVHIGGESAKSEGELTAGGRQLEGLQIESEILYFRKDHGLGAVFACLLLTILADAINLPKRIIRWRRPFGFVTLARRTGLRLSLLLRTNFGSRPTR